MRILLTAGPTHEPIDAVRYIGNHSSGKMGAEIAQAAMDAGHSLTLIAGPASISMPQVTRRIDVRTAEEMMRAVEREWPGHDLLIMAAAVADFRPTVVHQGKMTRKGKITIECEATADIAAAAAVARQAHQRLVGFSLEEEGNLQRAGEKLRAKKLDLIVYNPPATMGSADVQAVLIYPDGRTEALGVTTKRAFAKVLMERAERLWPKT